MPPSRPAAGTQPAAYDPAPALAHLRAADPVMAHLLDRHGPPDVARNPDRPPPGEHYAALLRAIVGQQLSTKAARAIYGRVLEFFGGSPPSPRRLLDADPEALRAAGGLSRAKVGFLRSLAEHIEDGRLELDRVATLPDDELIAELCAVKGIGEWSAHMFLMFQLERVDVLAVGDLGIRRAVQRAYGLDDLPSADDLRALGERWRPYRSIACRILWRSLDAEPVGG